MSSSGAAVIDRGPAGAGHPTVTAVEDARLASVPAEEVGGRPERQAADEARWASLLAAEEAPPYATGLANEALSGAQAAAQDPAIEHCIALARTMDSEGLLQLVDATMTCLRQRTLGGAVDDPALHASIRSLHELNIRVEAEKLRRIGEVTERRSHLTEGARTTADLLMRLGLTRFEARQLEEIAAALPELPRVAEGLARGRISVGQAAEAMKALAAAKRAAAADEAAEARRREAARDGEGGDTGAAGADADGADADAAEGCGRPSLEEERDAIDEAVAGNAGTDRRKTKDELERLAAKRRGDDLAERERRARDKRHGRKFRDGDGVTIQLHGPGAEAQKIWTMIQALARPGEAGEQRTQEQRNFDAAVEAAGRYLAEGKLPEVAGLPAQVILVTTPEALHGVEGAEPSRVDGVGPVSSETARMICCGADLHVVVTGEDGQPLRVGRARREPNRAQRRAVIGRDRVCIGCGADAARCEVHHIRWWRHRGPTDIENLALACWSCHTHIHHHGWEVTRGADGRYRAGPPGPDGDGDGVGPRGGGGGRAGPSGGGGPSPGPPRDGDRAGPRGGGGGRAGPARAGGSPPGSPGAGGEGAPRNGPFGPVEVDRSDERTGASLDGHPPDAALPAAELELWPADAPAHEPARAPAPVPARAPARRRR